MDADYIERRLRRHNVTDRRETLRMAHGDIHETKGNHTNLTAVGVGVRVDQQINRTPFSDQQIGPVAKDQRRQCRLVGDRSRWLGEEIPYRASGE